MSNYRAYASEADLVGDAVMVVTSGAEVIDVQVSDRLTIEYPDGRRIDALVLERGDGTMVIAMAEGRTVAMRITTAAHYLKLTLSGGPSRQCWVIA
ncbi:MAG: hypothetical protein EON57_00910 [Alphaproteobacteria bacterium]|nr:MAG: hypothetical protein EON57_00910 [Alphaproteobacteria bacterium]